MAMCYLPVIKPIPKNATKEEREKALSDYKKLLIESNPRFFDRGGKLKSPFRAFIDTFTKNSGGIGDE